MGDQRWWGECARHCETLIAHKMGSYKSLAA